MKHQFIEWLTGWLRLAATGRTVAVVGSSEGMASRNAESAADARAEPRVPPIEPSASLFLKTQVKRDMGSAEKGCS